MARALIRPSGRHNDRSKMPIIPLMMGFFFGCFFMYLIMLPMSGLAPTASYHDIENHASVRSASALVANEGKKDGWHPINVFFGDEAGLKIPKNQKWFAQVHQDETVIDLIGENGYFIDLAANDAKEGSNTLALEHHGWNGAFVLRKLSRVVAVQKYNCRKLLTDTNSFVAYSCMYMSFLLL